MRYVMGYSSATDIAASDTETVQSGIVGGAGGAIPSYWLSLTTLTLKLYTLTPTVMTANKITICTSKSCSKKPSQTLQTVRLIELPQACSLSQHVIGFSSLMTCKRVVALRSFLATIRGFGRVGGTSRLDWSDVCRGERAPGAMGIERSLFTMMLNTCLLS